MHLFETVVRLAQNVNVLKRMKRLFSDCNSVDAFGVRGGSVRFSDGLNFDVEFWFEIFHKLIDELLDVVFSHIDGLDEFFESFVVHDGVILNLNDEFVGGSKKGFEEKDLMAQMEMVESASDENNTVLLKVFDLFFSGGGLEVGFDERTLAEKLYVVEEKFEVVLEEEEDGDDEGDFVDFIDGLELGDGELIGTGVIDNEVH